MKRHHDKVNAYKGKTFNWGWLTSSEGGSIIIMVRHGSKQTDRYGAGKEAESFIS